jgi:hypothetical protein
MNGSSERVAGIKDSLCDWHLSILDETMKVSRVKGRVVFQDTPYRASHVVDLHANIWVVLNETVYTIEDGPDTSHPLWVLAPPWQDPRRREWKDPDYWPLRAVLDIDVV